MTFSAAEKEELERVVELLGRSTRPGRLLQFIGERCFQGRAEQLTEFVIATEVFGRSAKSFDAGQDAVVRVEAHRLRKKLREIYEKGAAKGGLQITIPAGTYVPSFSTAPEPPVESPPEPLPAGSVETESPAPVVLRKTLPTYYLLAFAILGAVIAFAVFRPRSDDSRRADRIVPTNSQIPPASAGTSAINELHLLAGFDGSKIIDNSGTAWTNDQYFNAGAAWSRTVGFVRGTSRPFLYTHSRTGEFSYAIPVAPGVYELRLFFVSHTRVGEELPVGFDVSLNGKPLLQAFDINVDALGADVADEKVFRDVSPGEDGFIRLKFTNQSGSPILNGLELVPGTPGNQKPIRITTQATSFVDHEGQRWRADDYYLNGFQTNEKHSVTGTSDPELFGGERFGHFSYAIPVDTRGRYAVVLHFVESYFGPQQTGGGGIGSRIFHVTCNGKRLLEDFDIYKEAGSLRVLTKTFTNIKPTTQGKINLMFEPVINNATISGIEVIDESD